MKKLLSLAIVSASLLLGSTGALASQCGVGYSGYQRPAPQRAVNYHQTRRAVSHSRNQCGRVTRNVQRNCGNRNYQRNYQRNRSTCYQHPMPRQGGSSARCR
ncbi:MAG: hypothetical protein WBP46_09970 [Thiolinea sp.]